MHIAAILALVVALALSPRTLGCLTIAAFGQWKNYTYAGPHRVGYGLAGLTLAGLLFLLVRFALGVLGGPA
jgi:hypothetical protein